MIILTNSTRFCHYESLKRSVLVTRYTEEIGQSTVLRLQFLLLVEVLWGVSVADEVEAELPL